MGRQYESGEHCLVLVGREHGGAGGWLAHLLTRVSSEHWEQNMGAGCSDSRSSNSVALRGVDVRQVTRISTR